MCVTCDTLVWCYASQREGNYRPPLLWHCSVTNCDAQFVPVTTFTIQIWDHIWDFRWKLHCLVMNCDSQFVWMITIRIKIHSMCFFRHVFTFQRNTPRINRAILYFNTTYTLLQAGIGKPGLNFDLVCFIKTYWLFKFYLLLLYFLSTAHDVSSVEFNILTSNVFWQMCLTLCSKNLNCSRNKFCKMEQKIPEWNNYFLQHQSHK